MSARNPPCQAEITFMHVLPRRMAGMTEAMTKLATSMDRLAAAIEKHNECVEVESAELPDDVRAALLEKTGRTADDKHKEATNG